MHILLFAVIETAVDSNWPFACNLIPTEEIYLLFSKMIDPEYKALWIMRRHNAAPDNVQHAMGQTGEQCGSIYLLSLLKKARVYFQPLA